MPKTTERKKWKGSQNNEKGIRMIIEKVLSTKPQKPVRRTKRNNAINTTDRSKSPNRRNNRKQNPRPPNRSRSRSQKRLYSQVVRDGSATKGNQRQGNGQNRNRKGQGKNAYDKHPSNTSSLRNRKFQNKGFKSIGNKSANKNERYIIFLEMGPQTPERDKETNETHPKEIYT